MAEEVNGHETGLLFDSASFAVVRSAELSQEEADKICDQLRLHGAEVCIDNYPEKRLDLEKATHIISTTSDFPDYHAATDRFIHVVRPEWVQSSIATRRLAHPRRYSPDKRLFLSDVVATCAELPPGDAEAIAGGILAMGGNYSEKLTSQTTHIIALMDDGEKVEQAKKGQLDILVVLPHWIDDCLRLGKRLDEGPYMFPDPEITAKPSDRAPVSKNNNNPNVRGAVHPDPSTTHPGGPQLKENTPRLVLKNKRVILSRDLGISQYLCKILEDMIMNSGGKIVDKVSQADMLVCKYRDDKHFSQAFKKGIDIGNLAWLFWIVVHDAWTSPLRRLLHYPVPREPIVGFKGLKISLSNYSGEARTYLENLIKAAGAECTKTLRQENTHLITAHKKSEKVAAAEDWKIEVINHLWLEESYARWKLQSISTARYTHFPDKTNLGDVVGQTEIDRNIIAQHFIDASADAMDIDQPEDPVHEPPQALDAAPSKVNVKLSKTPKDRVANGLRTPSTKRAVDLGQENATTPGTVGSRKSKDAAAAKLQSLTSDIALFEKEKKRAGGVVYGGRRKQPDESPAQDRKRSVEQMDDDEEKTSKKRQRKGPAPIQLHVLISGYSKWVGKPKDEDADVKKLRELGIVVVTDPSKADCLAAPRIVRTAKFITALAYAPEIVSTEYIDSCLEQDDFLPVEKFKLDDKPNEKKYSINLQTSRQRAKKNDGRLLAGRHIYCVDKIQGGFETYQAIVEANGGTCATYRGRRATIPSRRAESGGDTEEDPDREVYLISSDSKEDQKLWPLFVQMAEGSRKTPHVVRVDWLLDSAMCQQVRPPGKYELRKSTSR